MTEPTIQEDIAWERKLEAKQFLEDGQAELAIQRKLREEMAFLNGVLYPTEEDCRARDERIKANEATYAKTDEEAAGIKGVDY